MNRLVRLLPIAALAASLIGPRAGADIFYVDNLRGSDAFDGRSATTSSNETGPTQSIGKALELARHGDTIVIRNNGNPYYESLTLAGYRHSGIRGLMFTIVGNGAIVDGSAPVPPGAWKNVGGDLWRFTPWRKGYYRLFLNDKPLPEHQAKAPQSPRVAPRGIPAGHWMAVHGTIYYQATERADPRLKPFRYAARSVGLTLYNVIGVQVLDLTFRNFRLDGINAHDRCGVVKFEQVKSLNNGRAGFHVGGCSGQLRMTADKLPTILLQNCEVAGNRRHSLLFTNRGTAQVQDSKLDKKATQRD